MPLSERLWIGVQAVPAVAMSEAFWYLLFAGGAWLLFYVLLRRLLQSRKIVPRFPTLKQMSRETLYSLRSLLVFGIVGGLIAFAAFSGWTRFYTNIESRGYGWYFLSIVIMILMHDTYFYWTHRLMHHPKLFRWIHHTHHQSTNPSPWAAYSFSTWEAFVQAGIGPLIIFTLPVHPTAFLTFMIWQISFNVLGHCGFEIFPRSFMRRWFSIVLNTPTHHAMHHETFRANFSLYFNIWDRLLGTNHRLYAERFELVTSGEKPEVACESEPQPELATRQVSEILS